VMVNQPEKTALLTIFLQTEQTERTLVFSRTKHGADKIVRMLSAAGIAASAIHGNKSQAQREKAIREFKSGSVSVLVATDIAARGIDIPGVSHVINYDLPEVPEQYVHRIGRTARAGAEGKALAFCSPDERGLLRDIERLTRLKIDVATLPDNFNETAETLKRLKPAPKKAEEQPRRFSHGFKADRRADGQRREHRSDRQRHPHRADGHSAHRSSAQDRNGQRRDGQRDDGSRSSYRPEAYREADAGARPARPNRKFNGRRGRPGGPRCAQG
jgi:ATP-dependent RNA helicase RhlE